MLAVTTLTARLAPAERHLALLHGFLGAGRNLNALARRLAERLPATGVHLVDLPGHGASPPMPPGASLSDVAGMVWAALAAVAPARPGAPLSLVGHSLGGRVALAMAGQAAQRAPRLGEVVLLDISAGPTPKALGTTEALFEAVMAAPAEAARREDVRDLFVAQGISLGLANWATTNLQREGEVFRWRIDRAGLAAFQRQARQVDLWAQVAALGPRCRLLWGGASPFLSPADQARFAALGAQVACAPSAGHFIHVDAPQEVVDFVAGAGAVS